MEINFIAQIENNMNIASAGPKLGITFILLGRPEDLAF